MEFCIYDSKLPACKTPFGAVATQQEIVFHVRLPKHTPAERAALILCTDNAPDQEYPMTLCEITARENVYRVSFTPDHPCLYFYYFVFWENQTRHTINPDRFQCGVVDALDSRWQLTVYDRAMKRPACFGAGIMYQIFPDRFCNSGKDKGPLPDDRNLRHDWGALPVFLPNAQGVFDCSDYFCGDLKGIESKLDYLERLGVTCLYLNPIFEAHSNHRYNTANFMRIDPLLGTEQDFRDLCRQAKKRGIAVILDGVFNHTGSDSIYFNREGRYGKQVGAARNPHSPYFTWFRFQHYPDSYDCWWGFQTLPDVNETDPSYLDFICDNPDSVIHHWMNAGASGFRLDVADELPDLLIDRIHQAVKSHGKDCCVIGEVWEDASNKIAYSQRRRYLLGGQLDSVMNYPFRTCILQYIRWGDAQQFLTTINTILENYPLPVLHCAMNPLSTHDTDRAITALVGEPAGDHDRMWQAQHHYLSLEDYHHGLRLLKLACCIQYFLPGIPSLYYGDEAGLSGYRDPFNRCCYPWGYENHELIDWFGKLGRLRKSLPFLQEADFTPLYITSQLCAFVRRQAKEQILLAVNRGDTPCPLPLPADFAHAPAHVLCGVYREEDQQGILGEYSAVLFSQTIL